jgi:hypothetical protein
MAANKENEKQEIPIRIGNQDFILERRRVPVDWLKLDPNNQRLGYQLTLLKKEGRGNTDKEIQDLLWKIDAVKELYQSVLQNGGLIEDPFVMSDGLVIEGNSRTVVMRKLHKDFPGDERFANLFVRILPHGATNEQIITLIGEMHIAGKIKWDAYEEAEYMYKMHNDYAKTYDFLVAHLRKSRSKITQYLLAYEETKKYLNEYNDPNGIRRFTHFDEFMKKKELRDRIEKNPEFMKDFRKWVYEGKFPDSRDVRKLPEILNNSKAFEIFKKNSTQAAEMVLNKENPTRNSDLYFSIGETTKQLLNIPLAEIKELEAGNSTKLKILSDLNKALKEVATAAKISLG